MSVSESLARQPLCADAHEGDLTDRSASRCYRWGARRGVGELHSDLPSEEALERSGFLVKTNGDSRREAPFEVLFSVCGLKGHRERNEDRYSAVAHFAQNAALFAGKSGGAAVNQVYVRTYSLLFP